jgi:hypothetical protein
LHGAVKASQHLQGVRHGLGIEYAIGKNAFPEARDLALVVEGLQTAANGPGYLEPDRVRTDIHRSEGWHGNSSIIELRNFELSSRTAFRP